MTISHFPFEDPSCTWKSKMEPCSPNLTWSELANFNSNKTYIAVLHRSSQRWYTLIFNTPNYDNRNIKDLTSNSRKTT